MKRSQNTQSIAPSAAPHRFGQWLLSIALIIIGGVTVAPLVQAADSNRSGPVIEQWTTQNGARVYFVAAPELPLVDIQVAFDAAAARDGDKGGLAALTNALLNQGAGDLDATAIASRFESVGARFSSDSQRDMALVKLRSLTDAALLNPALETLELLLERPSFPAASVERERKRTLIALQAEAEALDEISDKALYKAVFRDHPYAQPILGTEESVKRITRDDIVAFHKRYYVAKNAQVVVVGALARNDAQRIAEQLTAKLPSGEAAPGIAPVSALDKPESVLIAHPSQQTHVLLGQPGMRRSDPDYFALYVGNHVLGGSGLVSRLADEIREKRGLSYSTFSYFAPMRAEGPYVLGLQTRNDQAELARQLLAEQLREFIAKGPTEAELTAAKQNITGSFPLRLASNSKIADYVALIGFYGLPLDYLDTFTRNVEAVTADQIRDAFKRRVSPDKLVTVVVGGGAGPGG